MWHLQQVPSVQIPFLDTVVSGAAEENVPLHHQRFNTVVMWWLKVVCRADAPQRAFSHIKQLQEAEDEQVLRQGNYATVAQPAQTSELYL